MIWVDASVWLEIALNQDKANVCERFLGENVEADLAISDFDIYSILLTLLRHKKKQEHLVTFLGVLSGFRNMTVFRPTLSCISNSISFMHKHKLTFDDALSYASMTELGIKKIATLDNDFRKLDVEFVI